MHRLLKGIAVVAALPLIAIPTAQAATVLMISPLTRNMQNELQGSMCQTGNTCVVVNAPAYPNPAGVTALDNAIKSTPGEIIVFGYSNGAQIVSEWLKQHANDPTAPSPNRLSFVLIGNPTRAYGGTQTAMPQTQYQVRDIARQYDRAADYPDNRSSRYYSLAVWNVYAGFFSIHANYENVNQYDPANMVWTVGNTTYVLVPTPVPPLCWSSCPTRKAQIEQAYNRNYPGLQTAQPVPTGTTAGTASALSASVVSDPTVASRDAAVPVKIAPEPTSAVESAPTSTGSQQATGKRSGLAVADTATTTPRADRADLPEAKQSTTAPTTRTTGMSATNGKKAVTGKAGGDKTTPKSANQATSSINSKKADSSNR